MTSDEVMMTSDGVMMTSDGVMMTSDGGDDVDGVDVMGTVCFCMEVALWDDTSTTRLYDIRLCS